MGMNKQEALVRIDKLRSVLVRIPEGIEWLCPSLDGHSFTEENPNILVSDDDEFSALAEYFNAQPSQRELSMVNAREWYAMTFEVDGVTLYNMMRRKREENEHGEQGSGNRESSGGLPDGESPEENRVEQGHSGSGHQADGEYSS